MSVINRNISVLLFAAIVLPAVNAQAVDAPARGPVPFEAFDKDGNKMISPQEFVEMQNMRKTKRPGAGRMSGEQAFTYFDKNSDNQISPEELETGRNAMRQQRGGMGPGMNQGRPQGMGQTRPQGAPQGMNRPRQMPAFADFDLNSDGTLTEDEFYQARDQRMRQRSEQGYPMRNAASAPPFGLLDANRDNAVTEQEFTDFITQHSQGRRRP